METSRREVTPHPHFLEALFTFRSKIASVFRDILGLHEIHHIAITQISGNEILTFSSTPAIEFNLFSSSLWHFDKTYHPQWFQTISQASWQSLYVAERYDELYYLKQIKHHYPTGYSLAAKTDDLFFIYSLASTQSCLSIKELFENSYDDFYKIGQYCTNRLSTLFNNYNNKPTTG